MAEDGTEKLKFFDTKHQEMLLKRLRKGEDLPFAFGLGKSPDEHIIAFDLKKQGKIIFNTGIKKKGLKKGAWGVATADGKVLKLTCEKELPGLKRHALKMLQKQPQFKGKLNKCQVFGEDGGELVEPVDDDLETEVDETTAAPGQVTATDTATATPTPTEASPVEDFKERFKALQPDLLRVLKEKLGPHDQIQKVATLAQGKSKSGDHKVALQAVGQLEKLIASAIEAVKDDPSTAYAERMKKLEPAVLRILKERIGDADGIRKVMNYAVGQADEGAYPSAMKTLDRLEQLVKAALDSGADEEDGTYEGLVEYRKALFSFAKAKTEVKKQIDALKKAIPAADPDEAELADELAAELENLSEELADAVDEAMSQSENEKSPITDAVKMKLRKYRTEVASNPLVKHVDNNPFGVKVSIEKTLGEALTQINEKMVA